MTKLYKAYPRKSQLRFLRILKYNVFIVYIVCFYIETIHFAHEFSVPTIEVSKLSVSEQKQYEKNLEKRDNFLDMISLT